MQWEEELHNKDSKFIYLTSSSSSSSSKDSTSSDVKKYLNDIRMPVDIQAALTVIGRRSANKGETRILDLSKSFLYSVDFETADLKMIDLSHSNLVRAKLTGANLVGTRFEDAKLMDADLSYANAKDAYFFKADLTKANFYLTSVKYADFTDAILEGAIFQGTETGEATWSNAKVSTLNSDNAAQLDEIKKEAAE
jgi:uncharacterized protein YjbI with pentapeptide repeats